MLGANQAGHCRCCAAASAADAAAGGWSTDGDGGGDGGFVGILFGLVVVDFPGDAYVHGIPAAGLLGGGRMECD